MARRTRAPMPVRRATAFAATSTALAGLAHAFGGGMLPSPWLLVLGGALVSAAVLPLRRREATWPLILVGLAGAQGFLHLWLAALGAHHHQPDAAGAGSASAMLLAHVLATVVAAIWLRYGEQRVWSAARLAWVGSLIRPLLPEPAPFAEPSRAVPVSRPSFHVCVHDGSSSAVRGPPRVAIH